MPDRGKDQERVEELYEESSRAYEERRRRQHILDWISYHRRQIQVHESTLGSLVDDRLKEIVRHQRALNGISTTEGEEDERVPA